MDSIKVSDAPNGTLFSGYTVLTKAMIGVGMLTLYKALGDSGWVWGMVITVVSPVVMLFSLHLLACLASDYKATLPEGTRLDLSYYKVASRLSKPSAILLEAGVIINCILPAVAFSVVSGTMLYELLEGWGFPGVTADNKDLITGAIKLAIGGVLAPLCYLKEIKKTTIPNAIAIGCLLYIVCYAIFMSEPYGDKNTTRDLMMYAKSWEHVIVSIPKFLFAYCCAQNLFGVANETASFSVRRLDVMAALATLTAIIFNFACSIFPFMTFGRAGPLDGNFIAKYKDDDSVATQIVRLAAIFQVSVGFVLVLHPLRASFVGIAQRLPAVQDKPEVFLRYLAATAALVLALGVSLALRDDLGLAIDLGGLIGANLMCFVIPCYLYCISRDRSKNPITWISAAALLVVGLVLCPLGIYAVIATSE